MTEEMNPSSYAEILRQGLQFAAPRALAKDKEKRLGIEQRDGVNKYVVSLDPFEPAGRPDDLGIVRNSQDLARAIAIPREPLEIDPVGDDVDWPAGKYLAKRRSHRLRNADNQRTRQGDDCPHQPAAPRALVMPNVVLDVDESLYACEARRRTAIDQRSRMMSKHSVGRQGCQQTP